MGRLHPLRGLEDNKREKLKQDKKYPAKYPYLLPLRAMAGLQARELCRPHAQAVAVALDLHVPLRHLG